MFIAKDFTQFKELFVSNLDRMLTDDELGAYILVLANSQQDEFLKRELSEKLTSTFATLKKNFTTISQSSTQDDIDVFNKLCDGFENSNLKDNWQEANSVWQHKIIGHWDVSFNPIRQLRPARASTQILDSISQAFDDSKFHFNKPFLKPEILWQGSYLGKQLRVLYNKFPFLDYHLLIAVSPEENLAQQLTRDAHQLIFSLASENAVTFPGFGVGFNSLAAGASVNHLHFQGFIRERPYPVEKESWVHNSGDINYPIDVHRFSDAKAAWHYIDELTQQDTAYNCLYRKDACYIFPRIYQGTVKLPGWLQGAGWLDVAGVITVSDKNTFDILDEQSVAQALHSLAI